MSEQSLFTKFWANEAKSTQKVIARIPDGSDYRPDPKSRTAREIAWQIVWEEQLIITSLENGSVEWAPPATPDSMRDVLAAYDAQSAKITERWQALPAEKWNATIEFFGAPRTASEVAWMFLFDIIHHRAQLTTYLRPMGSTVPQVYGPSADEP